MKKFVVFGVLIVSHIFGLVHTQTNTQTEYVPGEIIIKLKKEARLKKTSFRVSSLDRVNRELGVKKIEEIFKETPRKLVPSIIAYQKKRFGLFRIYKISLPEEADIKKAVAMYSALSEVEYAQPNYIRHICLTPNDPQFPSQCGPKKIEAEKAWDINTGLDKIIIAISDTGVDYNHQDLKDNIWINKGEIPNNNIDDDKNGYIDDYLGWDFYNNDNDPMDDHSHGTHVAGIAGARGNNGVGIAGVSWHCQIMPIKFLGASGGGTDENGAKTILYAAENGADVINMSWGGEGTSPVITDAARYAYSLGVVLVAAAGNDNADASYFSPANIDVVIAVAATDENDIKAGFSNWGDKVDVSAPGVNILSSVRNDVYESYSGTSMSAPHVSGLVALLLSLGAPYSEIRSILGFSCDPVTSEKPIGKGRINAFSSLQRVYSLYGKVIRQDNLQPIGGALIKAFRGTITASCISSGDGAYLLPLTKGTWTIQISRTGCEPLVIERYISGPMKEDIFLSPIQTYSIQGKVKLTSQKGLSNILLNVRGDTEVSTTTTEDGTYSFLLLYGTYTITPSYPDYTFSPSSRTYISLSSSMQNQDFSINPRIRSINPLYVPVYTNISLSGNGFWQNEAIYVSFGINPNIAQGYTSLRGEFSLSFSIDSQPLGTKTITVMGNTSTSIATTLFTIIPPYTISGFTKNASGYPVTQTLVSLVSESGTTTTTSDKNGKYIFNNLLVKAYTITAGDSFSPKERVYPLLSQSLTNQNFYKNEKNDPPWPFWGYNSQRTGVSPYSAKGLYPKWRFEAKNRSLNYPIIGYDGSIYSGVYRIDPKDGKEEMFGSGVFTPSCIGKAGVVYGTGWEFDEGYKYYLYAIWPDGEPHWKYLIGKTMGDAVIDTDGTIYVGSEDGYLYAISEDGKLIWRYNTGYRIWSSPALGKDGTIYIANNRLPNSELFALTKEGELKWQYELEGWSACASPIVWEDKVYMGAGVWFYCLSKEDGKLKWRFGIFQSIDNSPAIDENGTIYFAADFLYAITKDGKVKWKYPLHSRGNYRSYFSPVIDPNGIIYAAGIQEEKAILYAISRDGELVASYKPEDPFLSLSGCSISPDGTIYTNTYNRLYALAEKPSYTIRGNINTFSIQADVKIKEGVLVKLEGTLNATFTTGVDGFYSFTKLPPGFYTITPSKDGFRFIPGSQTCFIRFQDKTLDFLIREDAPYYIKGSVKESNGSYLANVEINLNGTIAYTSQDGTFLFTQLTRGTYTLIPKKEGYIFIPSQYTYNLFCSQDNVLFLAYKKDTTIYGQFLADSKHTGRVPHQGITAPYLSFRGTLTSSPSSPLIAADGTVYARMDGRLVAFDKNGEIKWKSNVGTLSSTYPAIGLDGTIYVVCEDEYLYALDPNNNKKWQCEIGGIPLHITISNDGNILLISDKLYSLSPLGSITWTYPIQGSLAQGNDGSIYITSGAILYSLTKDGILKWQMSAPSLSDSSLVLEEQGTLSISGYVWTEKGKPIRDIKVYLSGQSPSIKLTDYQGYYRFDNLVSGRYYRVTPYHPEYSFEPSDRKYDSLTKDMEDQDFVATYIPTPPSFSFTSQPAISDDGTIYIGGKNGMAYCLIDNLSTYTVKWMTSLPEKDDITLSPVMGLNGEVYITQQGRLYSLSPSDGKINWMYTAVSEDGYIIHPPLIDNEGMLYFIIRAKNFMNLPDTSHLYSLTPFGKLRWQWRHPREMQNPSSFSGSEIALGSGRIYLGAEEFSWTFRGRYYLYTISSLPPIIVTISPDPFVTPIRSFSYPVVSVFDIERKPVVDGTAVLWKASTGGLQGYPSPLHPIVYTKNGTASIQFFSNWKLHEGTLTAMVWEGEANKADVCLIITQDEQYLSSIEITPSQIEIPLDSTQTFLAVAWDKYSNEMSGLLFSWEVRGSIGRIKPVVGSFTTLTAPSVPGVGRVIAKYNEISGYCDVVVGGGKPIISVEPESGPVGTEISIYGAGFEKNGMITIEFAMQGTVITTTINQKGFFSSGFSITPQTGGEKIITAYDGSMNEATCCFVIIPSINVVPQFGLIGSLVTVRGDGFVQERVKIDFGIYTSLAEAAVSPEGTFTVIFGVDTQPYGIAIITATGLFSRDLATTSFIITRECSISGWVRDIDGDGVSGVNMYLTGNLPWVYSTKKDGYYEFRGLPENYYRRVAPYKSGWLFDPQDRIYNPLLEDKTNEDYTAWQMGSCKIVVTPISGEVKTLITIKGGIYQQNGKVRIDFGSHLTIATTSADSQGLFSSIFRVDTQPPGTKTITATGLSSFFIATTLFFIYEAKPIITIFKSSDKTKVIQGGTITYTITYKNEGLGTATDVTIIEVLPKKTKLIGIRDSGFGIRYWYDNGWQEEFSDKATKIRWMIPKVLPGQEGTISFTVRVK